MQVDMMLSGRGSVFQTSAPTNNFYLPFLYSSITQKMLWIMPVGRYVGCRMMWSMHQIAQI